VPIPLGPSARIHRLTLPLPLALRQVNLYLVESGEGLALVDTGMATPDARAALQRQLARLGHHPEQIEQVFVTHFHVDHFGQAAWLQGLGARIVMSRVDGERLRYWFQQPQFDRQALDYFSDLGVPQETLKRTERSMASMRSVAHPFEADHLLDDRARIELAGQAFDLLLTPGHSPGHACLHHAATRTLLVGDHILPHITPNISISHHSDEDPLGDYRRSLLRVRGQGYAVALPAHGENITQVDRRVDEILEHHLQRELLLLSLMTDGPRSCYTLSEGLFRISELDGWETLMAVGETLAHLRALEVQGRVGAVREDGVTLYCLLHPPTPPDHSAPC